MGLTIYGVLRSRASRTVWLARELGLAFKQVPVLQARRLPDPHAPDAPLNTASPAFLAIDPNGHIPVIDDDGLILGESLAINLYLARKHGGALAPADLAEEGRMTMWSLWAATEVEGHAVGVLRNRSGASASRDPAAAEAAIAALQRPFDVLDSVLAAGGGHLVEGRFTVADLNVAEVVRYAQGAPELFESRPAVCAWISACQARPAYREMTAEREREPA